MQNNRFVVYIEYSVDDGAFNVKAARGDDWAETLLSSFNFLNTAKSLVKFLALYKEEIINCIPSDMEDVSSQLESQRYLQYLDAKWYDVVKFDESHIIPPEQILSLGIKYGAIKQRALVNYLLKDSDEYRYHLESAGA